MVRAGDRAPDARLTDSAGKPVRLFDLLRGPHFTLLAFGGADLPQRDPRWDDAVRCFQVMRAGAAVTGALVDDDGEAYRSYGDGLVLIRPDGYVGYAGPAGGEGLAGYLARFFG